MTNTNERLAPEKGAPSLRVELYLCRRDEESELLEVGWRLQNLGDGPLELEESWLPHGQFRAERQRFQPPLVLLSGQAVMHVRDVDIAAADGPVVENAFLILRVRWQDGPWRVFARMRAHITPEGAVTPIVELVTASPVEEAG
jgi:hypothetical protein